MPEMEINKEDKDDLIELAKANNISADDIRNMAAEIYFSKHLAKIPENGGERGRQTSLVLKAKLNANTSFGDTITVQGVIFDMTAPTTFEKKDGKGIGEKCDLQGIFNIGDEKKLISMTVFNETISRAKDVPHDVLLEFTSVGFKESDQYGTQLTFNRDTVYKAIDGGEINVIEEINEMFNTDIMDVSQARMTDEGGPDKIVRGRVLNSYTTTNKAGDKILGKYKIYDDSVPPDELKEDQRNHVFYITCDPMLTKYDTGSLCFFIGKIQEGNDDYPPSMWANIIVPIMPFEKEQDMIDADIENSKQRGQTQNVTITDEEDETEEDTETPLSNWSD